jgi:outer membrane protein
VTKVDMTEFGSASRARRGARVRTAFAGTACFSLLFATGCHVFWPGIGAVDFPDQATEPGVVPVSAFAEDEGTDAPASLDEAVDQLREQTEAGDGKTPWPTEEAEPGQIPLTVDDLRLRVLQRNLDIEFARFAPELARQAVSAEEAKFDAIIGSRFSYARKDTPERDGDLVRFSSGDPALSGAIVKFTEVEQEKELTDLGLSVTLPLPTGGKISVGGGLFQKDLFSPQTFEEYVAATQFSLSQPLLRGAGFTANLASIRLARADQRLSEIRTKLAAMRILASSEKAYWSLYAARRLLDVRLEQFRLASDNLAIVRARVDQGLVPPVDVQRALAGVASRQEAVVIANTSARIAERRLLAFLAEQDLELGQAARVDPVSDPVLARLDLDVGLLVAQALSERPDLIALEVALVRDGILIDKRENDVLPIANLDFKYGLIDRDRSFQRAAENQWDFDNNEVFVGLSFELPLTNQAREARLQGAVLQRASRLASKRARQLLVRQEVFDAVDRVEQNWLRIVAARANVVAQAARYSAEQQQFLAGLRDQVAVLIALTDLGNAQVREVSAIAEYQASQIDLAFATGTLLGYSRVALTPLEIGRPGD